MRFVWDFYKYYYFESISFCLMAGNFPIILSNASRFLSPLGFKLTDINESSKGFPTPLAVRCPLGSGTT